MVAEAEEVTIARLVSLSDGPRSMRGEWRLMATVHNLLKLWRHDQRAEMAG